MKRIPRIHSVKALGPLRLIVKFENAMEKEYDCAPLLNRPAFRLLRDPGFFRSVKADPGGYSVSWNDDIDLSEYELWTNGKTMEINTSC
jgi:hypothetical protein